jgi:release factor glutamine methyltransferase
MQTIEHALREQSAKLLKLLKNQKQAWFEAELLLAHVLKQSRTHLVTHSSEPLSSTRSRVFVHLINRRLKEEPIAYLLGHAPFCDQLFLVDKRVLIPRPETEWLVERSQEILSQEPNALVWDVGTGSGAIALSIKQTIPHTQVIASDISSGALTVARKNAKHLKITDISFFQGSLLNEKIKKYLSRSNASVLLVIANLPYLPQSDKQTMTKQVVKYEPASALFAADHGSQLIKQLLQQLNIFQKSYQRALRILIELDPPQAIHLRSFSKKLFPNVEVTIRLDFNQKKRFLELYCPSPAKI